jgi:hypothetical protein
MSYLDIAVTLAVGAVLILAALALLNILSHSKQPALHAVCAALEPYALKAIFAGERFALLGLTQFDTKLAGADKATVANSIYDLLPDVLLVGNIPLPISAVKLLVPRDKFQELVKDVYDQSHAFIVRNEEYLKRQVDSLNLPASTT